MLFIFVLFAAFAVFAVDLLFAVILMLFCGFCFVDNLRFCGYFVVLRFCAFVVMWFCGSVVVLSDVRLGVVCVGCAFRMCVPDVIFGCGCVVLWCCHFQVPQRIEILSNPQYQLSLLSTRSSWDLFKTTMDAVERFNTLPYTDRV